MYCEEHRRTTGTKCLTCVIEKKDAELKRLRQFIQSYTNVNKWRASCTCKYCLDCQAFKLLKENKEN